MQLENSHISKQEAITLNNLLKGKGFPTPDRILILSPKGELKTKSGIIISSTVDKKDLPRKGVIIQNNSDLDAPVGSLVTYGMYAGKEITDMDSYLESINKSSDNWQFTILSSTEIVYVETNN